MGTSYTRDGKIEARGKWDQGSLVVAGAEYATSDL
jgi:hypothetical protein